MGEREGGGKWLMLAAGEKRGTTFLTHKFSPSTSHDAGMFSYRAMDGREKVHHSPEAPISWTLACVHMTTGKPLQGRETIQQYFSTITPAPNAGFFAITIPTHCHATY